MRILVLNYEFPPVGGCGGRVDDTKRFLIRLNYILNMKVVDYQCVLVYG